VEGQRALLDAALQLLMRHSQSLLGQFSVTDVSGRHEDVVLPLEIDSGHADLHGENRAVLPPSNALERRHPSFREHVEELLDSWLRAHGIDVRKLHLQQFRLGVAQPLAGTMVHIEQTSLPVDQVVAVVGVVADELEASQVQLGAFPGGIGLQLCLGGRLFGVFVLRHHAPEGFGLGGHSCYSDEPDGSIHPESTCPTPHGRDESHARDQQGPR